MLLFSLTFLKLHYATFRIDIKGRGGRKGKEEESKREGKRREGEGRREYLLKIPERQC